MVNVSDRIEACILHFAENQNKLKRKKGREERRRGGMGETRWGEEGTKTKRKNQRRKIKNRISLF